MIRGTITVDFDKTSTFDGVWIPRHDSFPDWSKMQSMTRCKCGELWNKHRFRDGACPLKKAPN